MESITCDYDEREGGNILIKKRGNGVAENDSPGKHCANVRQRHALSLWHQRSIFSYYSYSQLF